MTNVQIVSQWESRGGGYRFTVGICENRNYKLNIKCVTGHLYFVFSVVVVLDQVQDEVEHIFGTEVLDISE